MSSSEREREPDVPALGFETQAIHAGQDPDPLTGSVVPPIYQTSTYKQDGVGGLRGGYEYSRTANPTRTALETLMAKLEGAHSAFAFSSGMAARGEDSAELRTSSSSVSSRPSNSFIAQAEARQWGQHNLHFTDTGEGALLHSFLITGHHLQQCLNVARRVLGGPFCSLRASAWAPAEKVTVTVVPERQRRVHRTGTEESERAALLGVIRHVKPRDLDGPRLGDMARSASVALILSSKFSKSSRTTLL